MSNYLHNLVMRSFGRAEIAQPRVASLFEPLPAAAAFTPVDAVQNFGPARTQEPARISERAERYGPDSSAEVAPNFAPPPRPTLRSFSPSMDTEPPASQIEQETPAPRVIERQLRGKSIEPVRAEPVAEPFQAREASPAASSATAQGERRHASDAEPLPQRETHALVAPAPHPSSIMKETREASSPPQPLETIRAPERATIKFEDRIDESLARDVARQRLDEASYEDDSSHGPRASLEAAPPVIRKVFTDRVVERELSIERPSSLSHDETSTIRDVTNVKPDALTVYPRVARPQERGAPDDSQRARASSPEQVVQVTIGRIEVRAVSPPAQTRTEQRSAPRTAQSLEEYLRQRAKGGGSR